MTPTIEGNLFAKLGLMDTAYADPNRKFTKGDGEPNVNAISKNLFTLSEKLNPPVNGMKLSALEKAISKGLTALKNT